MQLNYIHLKGLSSELSHLNVLIFLFRKYSGIKESTLLKKNGDFDIQHSSATFRHNFNYLNSPFKFMQHHSSEGCSPSQKISEILLRISCQLVIICWLYYRYITVLLPRVLPLNTTK